MVRPCFFGLQYFLTPVWTCDCGEVLLTISLYFFFWDVCRALSEQRPLFGHPCYNHSRFNWIWRSIQSRLTAHWADSIHKTAVKLIHLFSVSTVLVPRWLALILSELSRVESVDARCRQRYSGVRINFRNKPFFPPRLWLKLWETRFYSETLAAAAAAGEGLCTPFQNLCSMSKSSTLNNL